MHFTSLEEVRAGAVPSPLMDVAFSWPPVVVCGWQGRSYAPMATSYCCGRSMKIGQQKKAKAEARHSAAMVKNSFGEGIPALLKVVVVVAGRGTTTH